MKLSNYEKETIINYSEGDKTASIYTHNETLKSQLSELCYKYPETVSLTADNGMALTFELPKKWIKIKPPRILSNKQKEVLAEINKKKQRQ